MPDATAPTTVWGRRAAALYDDAYAHRYRAVDDEIRQGTLVATFGGWLAGICDQFGSDIVALDLGCGTGRYFWALRHVRELVGVDVSAAMLAKARQPVDAQDVQVGSLTLIEGDFLSVSLEPGKFDLVYSIGVLGEHVPLDAAIAAKVHGWLASGGRFAFTAVHWQSFSVPRTWQRRMAEALRPWMPSSGRERLRSRLLAGGLYVDERYLGDVLTAAGFEVESIGRHESDVHLHCLCVARKA